ncbi:hypothetical protein PR202_gb03746 [Eleusine coracana subsp. coracana]|uniref:TIR domain-containing protein n=1 Tax=Eleusine coracana subsp. coracana TaxID=191504 RepID=A0AAV5E2F0_ELECO|nr:hypothetical protein QOZ80_1BG0096580 [Eleusine coracana subsp. coracana]GJN16726.1 hypothetical protein PR202_gb03746 [Eleusine coracana subsp. coracana]
MASNVTRSIASSQQLELELEPVIIGAKNKGRRVVDYDEDDLFFFAGDGGRRRPKYDVFINHRGLDTKRTVARLLYDRLDQLSIRSFLDNQSMRPGDHLDQSIFGAVRECSIAVAIFSKHYCDSDYCLRELAMLVDERKIIIPVFYDIEPADLVLPQELIDSNEYTPRDIERFRFALREARRTAGIGLTYDFTAGDMSELVSATANAVMERIQEMQQMTSQQQQHMIISRL